MDSMTRMMGSRRLRFRFGKQWFGYSAWPSFFRLLRRLKRTVDGGSFDRDMHVGEQARLSGQ